MKFVSALNGRGGTLSLEIGPEKAILGCEVGWTRRSISALSLDMLSLTFYSKLFAWLIAEPLTGLELTFSHQPLLDPTYLSSLLPCRSRYDGAYTAIAFDKQLLSRPIVKTQRQLTALLAAGPLEFLHIASATCLWQQVADLLHKALQDQQTLPPLDRIAYQLGKSGSTLRRRLADEGISFQALLDECRKQRALELLASTPLSVDEIACRVGFSERSAFSHAFKSWTSQTPSAYRDAVSRQARDTASAA
jgi:AraC-like DNA-binding protein